MWGCPCKVRFRRNLLNDSLGGVKQTRNCYKSQKCQNKKFAAETVAKNMRTNTYILSTFVHVHVHLYTLWMSNKCNYSALATAICSKIVEILFYVIIVIVDSTKLCQLNLHLNDIFTLLHSGSICAILKQFIIFDRFSFNKRPF